MARGMPGQRADVAARDRRVSRACLLQRALGRAGDEAVQPAVERVDRVEMGLGQFAGAGLAGAQRVGRAGDRQIGQVHSTTLGTVK